MQALSDCIKEIRNDSNISTWNEAQAKEWIIRPILDLLGWGHREIDPEHGLETRKSVDYTLQISGRNKVFIEAKSPKEDLENEKHQKQLFNYSVQKNPDLAILTNGVLWWFYLPRAEGAWNERKFYIIDILAQEIEDIVDKFGLLLSQQNVKSGKAVQHAESILKSSQREKIVKESLPEAWNKVIKNAVSSDSLLIDLLAETAAEVCGFKLENDEILGFIRSHHEKWLLSRESGQEVIPLTTSPITTTEPRTKKKTKKPKRMRIGDVNYELRYNKEIVVHTANWLIDKGHLKHTDCPLKISHRAKRSLIDSTPTHQTIGKKFTLEVKLKNGLYIETHMNAKQTIDYSKRLLEKYGYDPEILQIKY